MKKLLCIFAASITVAFSLFSYKDNRIDGEWSLENYISRKVEKFFAGSDYSKKTHIKKIAFDNCKKFKEPGTHYYAKSTIRAAILEKIKGVLTQDCEEIMRQELQRLGLHKNLADKVRDSFHINIALEIDDIIIGSQPFKNGFKRFLKCDHWYYLFGCEHILEKRVHAMVMQEIKNQHSMPSHHTAQQSVPSYNQYHYLQGAVCENDDSTHQVFNLPCGHKVCRQCALDWKNHAKASGQQFTCLIPGCHHAGKPFETHQMSLIKAALEGHY